MSWFSLLLATSIAGAESPRLESSDDFFREAHVWDVHLSLPAASCEAMEPEGGGRRRSAIRFPYVRAKVSVAGRSFTDVGLRYKGNSSFMAARRTLKRSFKIDFNRFVKGQKFLGLTKISLNNNILDPSLLREAISYSLFRELGLPASRTTFARVLLTVPGRFERRYVGLYTVVEQVNAAFLETRFGSRDGLIVKPERSLRFPYLGEDWEDGEEVWVPKSDVAAALAGRLVSLTRLVDSADDETFQRQIGDFVDLDQLAGFTALHTVLSHLDSFLLRGHNYYIVLPAGQQPRRLLWVPWDLNSTFAGHRSAGSPERQMDLDVDQPYARGNRLLERLVSLEGFRAPYRAAVEGLLRTQLQPGSLEKRLETLRGVIDEAARADETVDHERFTANFRLSGASDPTEGKDGKAAPRDRKDASRDGKTARRDGVDAGDARGSPARSGTESRGRGAPGRRRPDPFGTGGKPRLFDFLARRRGSIEAQLAGEREGYRPSLQRRGRRQPGRRPPSGDRPPRRPSGDRPPLRPSGERPAERSSGERPSRERSAERSSGGAPRSGAVRAPSRLPDIGGSSSSRPRRRAPGGRP